jgi:hypothetical protein
MATINFYPFYEPYLREGRKKTTFRMGDYSHFRVGDQVMITIGWNVGEEVPLFPAVIGKIYRRRIKDLLPDDFCGESPDCTSQEAARLVLGSIYRRVVTPEDFVWVIKFDYIAEWGLH